MSVLRLWPQGEGAASNNHMRAALDPNGRRQKKKKALSEDERQYIHRRNWGLVRPANHNALRTRGAETGVPC